MTEQITNFARAEVNRMAEELCRVQPMPDSAMRIFTDDDPLVHAMLSNFVARMHGRPLPYPYSKVPHYLDITRKVVEGTELERKTNRCKRPFIDGDSSGSR